MNEFQTQFAKGFQVGLRPTLRSQIGNEALVMAQGLVPEEGVLHSIEDITVQQIDTSSLGCTWPWPQIFVLQSITVVCSQNAIFVVNPDMSLTQVCNWFAPPNSLWTYADFGLTVILCNGASIIKLDGLSGEWGQVSDCSIMGANCIAGINGQLFAGGLFQCPQVQQGVQ
jgi:hypothetical protein